MIASAKVAAAVARNFRRFGLLACLTVVAGQGCGDGNEPGQTGALFGTVTAVGTGPAAGASVSVGSRTTQSDANGAYRLDDLPTGDYTLSASLSGYQPASSAVTILPGGEHQLDVSLIPEGGTPGAPTGINASPGSTQGSIRLTWEPVPAAQGYNIYWSTSPGVTPATGTRLSAEAPPFEHTGLTPATTYYYVVTAGTAAGESAPSPEAHATPLGSVNVQFLSLTSSGNEAKSVVARVQSVFALSDVTARIDDLSAPMTFDAGSQEWRAIVPLAGHPSPADILVEISATDVNGNVGRTSFSARFDRVPVLTVAAPVNGLVARPTAPLQITCTDDSPTGCVSVGVAEEEQGTVLFESPGGNVNTTISLAPYAGRQVFLRFRTVDDAGQAQETQRYLFVETTPGLTEAASAGSGIIVDADAGRLLVNNAAAVGEHRPFRGDTVRIVTRGSGASTTVFTDPASRVPEAHLTADGALLVTEQLGHAQVRQFRNGTLTTVTDVDFIQDFEVEGEFASWLELDASAATRRLVWRDLAAGNSDVVATSSQALPTAAADLAPNGDLVYVLDGEVFRYRGGTSQQVTDNAATGVQAEFARTDGTRIVQEIATAGGTPTRQLVLLDPGGDVVLASAAAGQSLDALMNNGWIAFTRYDAGGVAQIWDRAPDGTETQLSFLGQSFTLRLLNDDGEVVFGQLPTSAEVVGLYRAAPGLPAEQVVTSQATPVYIGGVLHAMFGASLFLAE
jgi:hypothetical protein